MKHKNNRRIFNRYTTGLFALVIIAAAAAIFITKHNAVDAAPTAKPAAPKAVVSEFTFTGATDWYQGPTRKGDMALFHKIQDSCFVSIQHITGTTIAADQAKKHKFDATLAAEGHIVTQIGTQNMTIKTNTGIKQYQLQQTSVSNPADASSSAKLDGGTEEGYLPLPNNDFIYVEGNCETASELTATIPALQAITFDAK